MITYPNETVALNHAVDFPISHGQASMWVLYRVEPESAVYNIARAAQYHTPVDEAAYGRALQRLVDRHPALRTTFHDTERGPIQRVHAQMDACFCVEDAPSDLTARLEAESQRPFDLERGPLMRFNLFRTGGGTHVAQLCLHHIISDGWSSMIFMQELHMLYAEEVSGTPADLPPLPTTFTAHVQEQRELLEGPEGEALLAYWREKLGGELPVLNLPTDRPRPAMQTHAGAIRSRTLPPDLTAQLRLLGRKNGATPFQTLLAAYQVFLHRYTGQDEIIVGSPTAGRNRSDLGGLIGYFVTPVALRSNAGGSQSFIAFLQQVKETVTAGLAHAAYPVPLLVDKLQVERDPSRTPIYQTMFVLQRAHRRQEMTALVMAEPGVTFDLCGITMEALPIQQQAAGCDLTLFAAEVDGQFRLSFEYNTDLFDGATIDRMLGHFHTLLESIVAAPATSIDELPLLTAEERHQLLVTWNETAADYPRDLCVPQLFERQAAQTPDAIAVAGQGRALTYAELNRRANQLAGKLRGLGVGPESIVGVCMERTPELVVGLLAIWKAGGAYLPVDPTYPRERQAYMLADSAVQVLLTQAHLMAGLPDHQAQVICVDADSAPAGDEENLTPSATPDCLAYIIYTSGSTGRPKGAMIHHRGLVNYLWWAMQAYHVADGAGAPVHSSVSFDLTVTGLWAPLLTGKRVELVPEALGIEGLATALREPGGFSLVKLTPAHVELISRQLTPAQAAAGAGALVIGGEALLPETIAFFRQHAPQTALINEYGPTETVVGCCVYWVKPDDRFHGSIPIGRPIANTYLYILDKQMEPVPVGVAGELYIGGDGVCRGYLNRPDLTAERFLPDPFRAEPDARIYKTGDLARWLPDGNVDYLGRMDEQVKLRGFRIELGEIETAMAAFPAVQTAAAVVRQDAAGRRLVGYLVPRPGCEIDLAALKASLKDRLPEYMIPSAFVVMDELPLSPNGKVDRKALPAPEAAALADFVAPASAAEAKLAAIWCQVLGLERVSTQANFFELGGDSILSIQVVSRANQAGLKLSPRDLFQYPTVAGLAAVAGVVEARAAEEGPVTGPVMLAPIQHWFLDGAPADPHQYNQAVLLELRRPLDAAVLQRALSRLIDHHDALRLRFVRTADGGWAQTCAAPGEQAALERFDTPYSETTAARVQASLDLGHGPLLRAALFTDRLLIVIHHLAVDGVSWRILLEDLETLCQNPDAALAPRTTSYQRWTAGLAEYARSGALEAEAAYWHGLAGTAAPALPVDTAAGANTQASSETVTVALTAEETRALLQAVPAAYRTRMDDVLLTALTRAVTAWTGGAALLVDLEGHGREEEILPGADLSRTVGWFTAIYPVRLTLDPTAAAGAAIKAVKEQLRAVPGKGIGYGLLRYLSGNMAAAVEPEISFNYLGRMDQVLTGSAHFAPAAESTGPARSGAQLRRHLLEIDAMVIGDQLKFTWTYSANRHHRSTVAGLAEACTTELRALIAHCVTPGVAGATPSDFPRAHLTQTELDRLLAQAGGAAGVADVYRLTPVQSGMHFHNRMSPGSGVYHVQVCLDLKGALNAGALERAWRTVTERHAILRTTFHHQELPEPVQVVHRQVALTLARPALDLETFLQEDRERGFDLTHAPLMRLALFADGPDRHTLVWSVHHLLIDGWSLSVLLQEVFAAYEALAGGGAPALAAVRPFGEYLAWLESQEMTEAEAYWRRTLAGFTAPTPLPAGLAAPGETTGPDAVETVLPEPLVGDLTTLTRKYQLTLNTLVQGAWALLLSRYSGQNDVLFGTTVAGRPATLPGVETMAGPFINTLPARVQLDESRPVAEFLRELQAQQAELREFEQSPLVDIQGWSAIPRSLPLFESIVVFENYPLSGMKQVGGLELVGVRDLEQTNYPLTLAAMPSDGLTLKVTYDRSRLDGATVGRMLGHLQTLLTAMADRPEAPLADLGLLTPAEELQLLDWNATAVPFADNTCIHRLFEARVAETPTATALIFGDEVVTYDELNRRANRLAHHLKQLGVGPEIKVGVCAQRSPAMVVGLLAVLKAGGAYLPLDPAYPADRLAYMLADANVDVVLTQSQITLPVSVANVVLLDAVHDGAEANLTDGPAPDNLAYSIYTSGSTGRPKGVLLEHRGLCNLVEAQIKGFAIDRTSRVLQFAAFSFDASVSEIFTALAAGATLVLGAREDLLPGPGLVRLLQEQAVSVVTLPPSVLAVLPAGDLPGLKTVVSAGEACSAEIVARWAPGRRFINAYGPTEATVCATLAVCSDPALKPSIGGPLQNVHVYVLDEMQRPVPAGVPGELYIGGAGVARGYHNLPDLTAERFRAWHGDRVYKTGDRVAWLPDGTLEYIGRIDNQVKLRGFRIELGEIEAALRACPGVRDAAVIAREDLPGDQRLVAYIVPDPGAVTSPTGAPEPADLKAHLAGRLPEYMVPSAFVTMAEFPVTPNGKVDRKALPAPAAPAAAAAYVPPRLELERQLCEIWAEVLGVPRVGLTDNFFELGGHSLLATRMIAKVQQVTGQELPLSALFQGPTVGQVVAALQGRPAGDPLSPLVGLRTTGTRPPIFCVHPAAGPVLVYVELARLLGPDQPVYAIQAPGLYGEQPIMDDTKAMAARYIGEIRKVQPHGPYHIAGWSLGGIIAYEMGRLLLAEGEEVPLLTLIDTFVPPGAPQTEGELEEQLISTLTVRLLARYGSDEVSDEFFGMGLPEKRTYLIERFLARNMVPPGITEPHQIDRWLDVYKANIKAYIEYQALPYPGRVGLFRAADTTQDSLPGWRRVVTGELVDVTCPGSHYTMVEQPLVPHLARAIRKELDRAAVDGLHQASAD